MNHAVKAMAHEIKIRRVAYFYSAAVRRSRGVLWPSFAPALRCVSFRLRDEGYIKVSAHQTARQIGRRLTVDADFQVRVQGQPDGVEQLYENGVHIR